MDNVKTQAAGLALGILDDRAGSPADRTYALKLLEALKAGRPDWIEIQLARITGPEAKELLAELRAVAEPVTADLKKTKKENTIDLVNRLVKEAGEEK